MKEPEYRISFGKITIAKPARGTPGTIGDVDVFTATLNDEIISAERNQAFWVSHGEGVFTPHATTFSDQPTKYDVVAFNIWIKKSELTLINQTKFLDKGRRPGLKLKRMWLK